MQKKPWLLKIILSIMVASLLLNIHHFKVIAGSHLNDAIFNDSLQESRTPTPIPAGTDEKNDICGLEADDCGDPENASAHSAGMNFDAHPNADVVIILFWMEDCAHCAEILNSVLPGFVTKYNDQIYIFPIELKEIETIDSFYQMAERLGVQKNDIGVPLVIIGNQVLTGDQIESGLSNWVEKTLQSGNKTILAIPEFEDQLPVSIQNRQMNAQDLSNVNAATHQNNNSRTMTIALVAGIPVLIVVLFGLYFYFRRTNPSKV
ncbi:MAG: hypothetical protein RBT01_07390 [Anaerolineaceae bacterium]|jgi:thiol-disulfide isomerase/thioredoxin|nr:hypothetical protein [Anaerolineaceae bacterium]